MTTSSDPFAEFAEDISATLAEVQPGWGDDALLRPTGSPLDTRPQSEPLPGRWKILKRGSGPWQLELDGLASGIRGRTRRDTERAARLWLAHIRDRGVDPAGLTAGNFAERIRPIMRGLVEAQITAMNASAGPQKARKAPG